ncbi:hypothetical protein BJY04DRAFT_178764 [Aspergillus karnatakaensis]|uniref:uncharacterized protein n=1 Tax=Aspergillus karnatakaensis TaxID=1810916 RepID=UPI003CCCF9B7
MLEQSGEHSDPKYAALLLIGSSVGTASSRLLSVPGRAYSMLATRNRFRSTSRQL